LLCPARVRFRLCQGARTDRQDERRDDGSNSQDAPDHSHSPPFPRGRPGQESMPLPAAVSYTFEADIPEKGPDHEPALGPSDASLSMILPIRLRPVEIHIHADRRLAFQVLTAFGARQDDGGSSVVLKAEGDRRLVAFQSVIPTFARAPGRSPKMYRAV